MQVSILSFDGALGSAVQGMAELVAIGNQAAQSIGVNHRISASIVEITQSKSPTADSLGEVIFVPPQSAGPSDVMAEQSHVIESMRTLAQGGKTVNGCCSGVLLMAEAGLLKNRKATTTWWLINQLSKYASVDVQANAMLVHDTDVVTSSGPYSYLYHALHIIEGYLGADVARLCAKLAVVEPGRPMNGIFAVPSVLTQSDPFLVKFQEITVSEIAKGLTVEKLAEQLHVSSRTLHRRVKELTGLSPNQLISQIRLEMAKTLLETTSEPIVNIAMQVGFEDTSSFRTAFSRGVGLSPTAYRSRMSLNPPSKLHS